MYRVGNQQKLLVVGIFAVPGHILKGVLAKVAGVRLIAVDHQNGGADLVGVLQDRLIHKGQTADRVPAVVGVERALMIGSALVILAFPLKVPSGYPDIYPF